MQPHYEISPKLLKMMRRPTKQIRVAVIDDNELAMHGILAILLQWPRNIFTAAMVLADKTHYNIPGSIYDIALINEEMRPINGTAILEQLRENGFKGVTASITSDANCPPAFRYHFPDKYELGRCPKKTGDFIAWMNSLIFEAEQLRRSL